MKIKIKKILSESTFKNYDLMGEIGSKSPQYRKMREYLETAVKSKTKIKEEDIKTFLRQGFKSLLYRSIAQNANFYLKDSGKKALDILNKMIMAQKGAADKDKTFQKAADKMEKLFNSSGNSFQSKYKQFKLDRTGSRTWNFVSINNKKDTTAADAHKLYLSISYDFSKLESVTDERQLADVLNSIVILYISAFFSIAKVLAEPVERDPDYFTSRIRMKMGASAANILGYNDSIIIYASTPNNDEATERRDLRKVWSIVSKEIQGVNSLFRSQPVGRFLNLKLLKASERAEKYNRPTLGRDTSEHSDTKRFIANFINDLTSDQIQKLIRVTYLDEKDKYDSLINEFLDQAMQKHMSDLKQDEFGF